MINRGERLKRPPQCPFEILQIMLACWAHEATCRPTFQYLVDFFKKLKIDDKNNELEYVSIRDLNREIQRSENNYNNNNTSTTVTARRIPILSTQDIGMSIPMSLNGGTNKDFVINRNDLEIGREIGKGEFAVVLEGMYRPRKEVTLEMNVAIKKMYQFGKQVHNEFLNEFSTLVKVNHPNVVRLIGVVVDQPQMIIQELCPQGSLLNYVRLNKEDIDPNPDMNLWCYQIAAGMNYLATTKNIIHRNLALRNILMQNREQVKIADFGIAKVLNPNQDVYTSRSTVKYPIKWCAPETIKNREFSIKSDVYSFGVLVWEIYTFGEEPWGPDVNSAIVQQNLDQSKRLSIPWSCPAEVYNQLLLCWDQEPTKRPTFSDLMDFFEKIDTFDVEHDIEYLTAHDDEKFPSQQDKNANINPALIPSNFVFTPDRVIDSKVITFKDKLGEGEFASVYSAVWNNERGAFQVAVKQLKSDKANKYRDAFLQEFSLMMKLEHLHIVKLLGIVTVS